MRRRSERAACSRACCAEWSSRCCWQARQFLLLRRPRGGTRPALRSAARPAPLGALADAPARPLVRAERACGESVVCPAHRRRAVPHLRPRGKRFGRSGLFLPGRAACFCPFLEASGNFLRPPDASLPAEAKIFSKNGNFFEKHLFIGEKIGYNKKQTPPHAAVRYQQRGRRAGCACENHHSLQNF